MIRMSTHYPPTSPTPVQGSVIITAADDYARKIYKYALEVRQPHFLEFRHLQRVNLSELQNELARKKGQFAESGSVSTEELVKLRETLHSYGM